MKVRGWKAGVGGGERAGGSAGSVGGVIETDCLAGSIDSMSNFSV